MKYRNHVMSSHNMNYHSRLSKIIHKSLKSTASNWPGFSLPAVIIDHVILGYVFKAKTSKTMDIDEYSAITSIICIDDNIHALANGSINAIGATDLSYEKNDFGYACLGCVKYCREPYVWMYDWSDLRTKIRGIHNKKEYTIETTVYGKNGLIVSECGNYLIIFDDEQNKLDKYEIFEGCFWHADICYRIGGEECIDLVPVFTRNEIIIVTNSRFVICSMDTLIEKAYIYRSLTNDSLLMSDSRHYEIMAVCANSNYVFVLRKDYEKFVVGVYDINFVNGDMIDLIDVNVTDQTDSIYENLMVASDKYLVISYDYNSLFIIEL